MQGKELHVENLVEFKKIIENLLLRARGDSVDSIRVASQTAL